MSYELWLGDCLEEMDRIEDGSIDCILADLPYGTTACKWDVVIPFEPLWRQYKRVIKKRGAVVHASMIGDKERILEGLREGINQVESNV